MRACSVAGSFGPAVAACCCPREARSCFKEQRGWGEDHGGVRGLCMFYLRECRGGRNVSVFGDLDVLLVQSIRVRTPPHETRFGLFLCGRRHVALVPRPPLQSDS